jgi:2-isopropylmalate synthase
MASSEKLSITRELLRLKVDIIEAGFPASSPGDFASVQKIVEYVGSKAVVCALARALPGDIEAAGTALAQAERARIHTGLGVSPCHLKDKLQMSPEDALNSAIKAVKLARTYTDDVQFYAEDAGRAERSYLARVLTEVLKAGATTVNVPDTTGYLLPQQYAELISWLMAHVEGIDKATVAVHCHNDLGMATASSIAGVAAGASQVECTINGIGERAGNAALEEVVMALDLHHKELGVSTNIRKDELTRASRLIAAITGMSVPANKAVVGSNAFAHSSGIHQDGVLKCRSTYEIIDPVSVGARASQIVLTVRSGRAALKHRLGELGYTPDPASFNQIYDRFLDIADKKNQIYDEDLEVLMAEHGRALEALWKLKILQVSCGSPLKATATIVLEGPNGEECDTCASGTGPIDATFKAIDALVAVPQAELLRFAIQAVTRGSDALGEVSVQLSNEQGQIFSGRGADGDIIVSSAKAYLNALNRLLGSTDSSLDTRSNK